MTRLTNSMLSQRPYLDHTSEKLAAEAARLRTTACRSVEQRGEPSIALMLFDAADEVEAFAADLASIGH